MRNNAYINSGRNKESDECLTPRYAVEPIIKYLKQNDFVKIWCPFDKDESFFVRVLKREGFNVINTHIEDDNGDFFKLNIQCDCIVSNPPFSIKDEVLERLYELGYPFMILLPQNALQSQKRTRLFIDYGLQYLGFDNRVHFYTRGTTEDIVEPINGKYPEGAELKCLGRHDCFYVLKRKETDKEMYSKIKLCNHFASAYFCRDVLPSNLIFEQIKIIQEPYFSY